MSVTENLMNQKVSRRTAIRGAAVGGPDSLPLLSLVAQMTMEIPVLVVTD